MKTFVAVWFLTSLRCCAVIFFDYDDTILSSTHLAALGHRLDTTEPLGPELTQQLQGLEQSVLGLLTKALRITSLVHIVTNAEHGWVQLSCQKFMPSGLPKRGSVFLVGLVGLTLCLSVLPMLDRLRIISARSTYEPHYPNDSVKWKYMAFQSQIVDAFGSVDSPAAKNVLSFGTLCVFGCVCGAVFQRVSTRRLAR